MFADDANHIYTAMSTYNLIKYSDNYSHTSGSLWQFRRDEVPANNADSSINNSQSFKYKSVLVEKTKDFADQKSFVKDAKTVVPIKYLNSFWRSLEMPLIIYKVHLELNWIEDCILVLETLKFDKILDNSAKLHVSIVTLSTKDSVNLTKQLSKGFKRSVYWNSYQKKPEKVIEKGKDLYKLLNASFQGIKILFVLAYVVAADAANDEADIKDNKNYFLPRGKINNYNLLIDGRNFYNQPINDLIKQYDEVRKVSAWQGDNYTTGCLLD